MTQTSLKTLIVYLPNGATQVIKPREGFAGDYAGLAETIGRPYYPQKVPVRYEIK